MQHYASLLIAGNCHANVVDVLNNPGRKEQNDQQKNEHKCCFHTVTACQCWKSIINVASRSRLYNMSRPTSKNITIPGCVKLCPGPLSHLCTVHHPVRLFVCVWLGCMCWGVWWYVWWCPLWVRCTHNAAATCAVAEAQSDRSHTPLPSSSSPSGGSLQVECPSWDSCTCPQTCVLQHQHIIAWESHKISFDLFCVVWKWYTYKSVCKSNHKRHPHHTYQGPC